MVISQSHQERWCHLYMIPLILFKAQRKMREIRKMIPNWGAEIWGGESGSSTTG